MMTSLKLIQISFPQRGRLTLKEACVFLGIPLGTARNQISQKRFPLRITQEDRLQYVLVQDLADYLDTQAGNKRRGRPTKTEQIARQTAVNHE